MSLFVNPNGKIVISAGNKPIECGRCPCLPPCDGDPHVYCVTEEFYSGDNCSGSLLNTLEHQCMCMNECCDASWDQVTFCQGRVKYTYEAGPHFISCPNNCIPIVPVECPSDCPTCGALSVVITGVTGGGMCTEFNTTYSVSKIMSCIWNGSKTLPSMEVALSVICNGTTWNFWIGLGDGLLEFTMPNTTGCPTGTYAFSACGSVNCGGCDFSAATITVS
jgi:hypothetical protein